VTVRRSGMPKTSRRVEGCPSRTLSLAGREG
jgi:hypothetical protein